MHRGLPKRPSWGGCGPEDITRPAGQALGCRFGHAGRHDHRTLCPAQADEVGTLRRTAPDVAEPASTSTCTACPIRRSGCEKPTGTRGFSPPPPAPPSSTAASTASSQPSAGPISPLGAAPKALRRRGFLTGGQLQKVVRSRRCARTCRSSEARTSFEQIPLLLLYHQRLGDDR